MSSARGATYAALVTDGRPAEVWANARAERRATVGWEPDDWNVVLRRQRRSDVLGGGLGLVLIAVVVPLPQIMDLVRPEPWSYSIFLLFALYAAAQKWWPHSTARGRAKWEQTTRLEIRVEHALREHVSIGAADRDLVTERAEAIRSLAFAHVVGWPLLAVFVVAVNREFPQISTAEEISIGLLVVGLSVAALVHARRRLRWAHRWLAHPLPWTEEARWT